MRRDGSTLSYIVDEDIVFDRRINYGIAANKGDVGLNSSLDEGRNIGWFVEEDIANCGDCREVIVDGCDNGWESLLGGGGLIINYFFPKIYHQLWPPKWDCCRWV